MSGPARFVRRVSSIASAASRAKSRAQRLGIGRQQADAREEVHARHRPNRRHRWRAHRARDAASGSPSRLFWPSSAAAHLRSSTRKQAAPLSACTGGSAAVCRIVAGDRVEHGQSLRAERMREIEMRQREPRLRAARPAARRRWRARARRGARRNHRLGAPRQPAKSNSVCSCFGAWPRRRSTALDKRDTTGPRHLDRIVADAQREIIGRTAG